MHPKDALSSLKIYSKNWVESSNEICGHILKTSKYAQANRKKR